MERSQIELLSSLFTVVFSISAIIIFIYYGGRIIFYVLAALALIAGLFNAWVLSKGGQQEPTAPKPASPKSDGRYVNVAKRSKSVKRARKRAPRKKRS